MLKKLNGFTLAEVLITLGIIGVVAAITIPTLMNNIQDVQYKTAFKKEYSSISQAYSRLAGDNGGTLVGVTTYGPNGSYNSDLIKPYLSYAKACDNSAVSGGCWNVGGQWFLLDKTAVVPSAGGFDANSALILNDGSFLLIPPTGGFTSGNASNGRVHYFSNLFDDCNDGGNNGLPSNAVIGLLLDTNGFKKPNTLGKDIFEIYIGKNGETMVPQNCSASSGITNARDYLMNK